MKLTKQVIRNYEVDLYDSNGGPFELGDEVYVVPLRKTNCHYCNGTGKDKLMACHYCNGTGLTFEKFESPDSSEDILEKHRLIREDFNKRNNRKSPDNNLVILIPNLDGYAKLKKIELVESFDKVYLHLTFTISNIDILRSIAIKSVEENIKNRAKNTDVFYPHDDVPFCIVRTEEMARELIDGLANGSIVYNK